MENDNFIKKALATKDNICAIGNIEDKTGYQRVKINIKYFRTLLKFSEVLTFTNKDNVDVDDDDYENEGVFIFVKNDMPVQIGKEHIGLIISPMVKD